MVRTSVGSPQARPSSRSSLRSCGRQREGVAAFEGGRAVWGLRRFEAREGRPWLRRSPPGVGVGWAHDGVRPRQARGPISSSRSSRSRRRAPPPAPRSRSGRRSRTRAGPPPRHRRSASTSPSTAARTRRDLRLRTMREPRLKKGKSKKPAGRSTIPASTPAGSYFVLACADDPKKVKESNERANCRASKSKVAMASPSRRCRPRRDPRCQRLRPQQSRDPSRRRRSARAGLHRLQLRRDRRGRRQGRVRLGRHRQPGRGGHPGLAARHDRRGGRPGLGPGSRRLRRRGDLQRGPG